MKGDIKVKSTEHFALFGKLILGNDICQVEIFDNCILVNMRNGDTIEFYSDNSLHVNKYDYRIQEEDE